MAEVSFRQQSLIGQRFDIERLPADGTAWAPPESVRYRSTQTATRGRSDGDTNPIWSIVSALITSAPELTASTAARVTFEITSPRIPSDADKIFPTRGASDSCEGMRNGSTASKVRSSCSHSLPARHLGSGTGSKRLVSWSSLWIACRPRRYRLRSTESVARCQASARGSGVAVAVNASQTVGCGPRQ